MAGSCSNLVIGNRELGGNGASLLRYNGLRQLENIQTASAVKKTNGFFASSTGVY